jgi:hypothetical protein
MLTLSLLIAAFVGVSGVFLFRRLNKGLVLQVDAAKIVSRRKLAQMSSGQSIEELIRSIDVPEGRGDQAKRLLALISNTVGVSDAVPPGNLSLVEIFRVPMSDVPHVDPRSYPKEQSSIEPFADALIFNLLSLADKHAWNRRAAEDASFPQSEEELIERIMGMTVAEFIQFFAPVIK